MLEKMANSSKFLKMTKPERFFSKLATQKHIPFYFRDANTPYGVIETDTGDIIPIETEDNIRSREAAMLINTLLIILAFLDIIFSLPSVIICLRFDFLSCM